MVSTDLPKPTMDPKNPYTRAFSELNSTDIWAWLILCCGGLSVHCEIFSSISGLYLWMPEDYPLHPLTAVVTVKKCLPWPYVPLGAITLQLSLISSRVLT